MRSRPRLTRVRTRPLARFASEASLHQAPSPIGERREPPEEEDGIFYAMPSLYKLLLPVCLVAVSSAPLYAQSEPELRDFFEGKSVVLKLDMPATAEGVDIFPDARRAIDFAAYSARLKATGIAIRNGDSVLVTKVRVKDKIIEFQLAGGGFGTFGDDTSTSVYTPSTPKSNREKDLEKLVKNETNRDRKRQLERELDDLRNRREREDSRNKAASVAAEEAKKTRIATTRLHSGSRFNIRYNEGVPRGLGADGVMRALAEYVDFPFAQDRRPFDAAQGRPAAGDRVTAQPAPRDPAPGGGAIRKGMTMADVEQALGRPDKESLRNEGSLKVVTATYTRGDQVITVDYVEGVLIKYAISSK